MRVSQWATVLLTIISAVVTFYMDSITGAWQLLIGIGAGTGTVLILRWYWWRINAWSEVSAMSAAFVVSVACRLYFGMGNDDPLVFAKSTLVTVGVTTVVWLVGDIRNRARAEGEAGLVLPASAPFGGALETYSAICPDVPPAHDMGWNFLDWICGCVMIYSALFGIGKIILEETALGIGFLLVAAAAGGVIYWDLSRRGWATVLE